MTALLSGGALARALILLVALTSAALAQAPTASDWRSIGATWVELCTAPCRVTNPSSFPARVAVGSVAPASDDAAAAVLTSGESTRDFAVAGLRVYGRALTNPTRVVIEPLGGTGGGSGGASTVAGSQEQDIRSAGTVSAATLNATYTVPLNGQGTVGFAFSGLTASGATLAYEQSIDGTTWTGMNEVNAGTGAFSPTRTTDGQVRLSASGRTGIRVRVSVAGTGTITVASNVSVREGFFSPASPTQIAGLDGTTPRVVRATTTGAIEPPTAAAGKIVATSVTLTANTSTTLVAANDQRIAIEIQCDGAATVGVSRTGAALTSATAAPLVIPTGSYPLYTMPVATLTAVTAYTGTGQTCRVTEYLR